VGDDGDVAQLHGCTVAVPARGAFAALGAE